jgi:hypothetical protein
MNEPHDPNRTRLSGLWVTTYFVAAFSLSAIGLPAALGQKPDQIS